MRVYEWNRVGIDERYGMRVYEWNRVGIDERYGMRVYEWNRVGIDERYGLSQGCQVEGRSQKHCASGRREERSDADQYLIPNHHVRHLCLFL